MIEHIQARLGWLRSNALLERDTMQYRIWSALIDEYQSLLEHLQSVQPL
jgi:hypothetical protein